MAVNIRADPAAVLEVMIVIYIQEKVVWTQIWTFERENSLLQLEPIKIVEECCEFGWYLSLNHAIFKILSTRFY